MTGEGGKGDGKRSATGKSGGGAWKKAKHANVKNPFALPIGKQGILVTVERAEPRKASKEAIMVLNEVYEALDPGSRLESKTSTPEDQAVAKTTGKDKEPDAAVDFSSLINDEVTDLKDHKTHRFRFHETGLRNCLFLEMAVEEGKPGPCEVVKKLMRDTLETKQLRLRFCLRFLPCTHIFKSDIDSIKANAAKVIPDILDCSKEAEPQSVAVLFEHRAAPEHDRMKVIDLFVDNVPRPPHTVKLKGASKTISVQIVKNACGVSVIDDYHELMRCNVRCICEPPPKPEEKKLEASAATADKAEDKSTAGHSAGPSDSCKAVAEDVKQSEAQVT